VAKRRYIRRRNGIYPPLKLDLEVNILLDLQTAARLLGKESPQRLAAELLRKIVADNLYAAVLDEE
jgi:hypothetical protein